MNAVPLPPIRKPSARESPDLDDEAEVRRRALHAEFRELEEELFYQHARGLRDASRRLVKK